MEMKLPIVILYEYPNSKRRIVRMLTPDFSETSFCVSLEAILYRLSHVYGVQFTVKSEALKRRTFTGTFYRGQSIKDIMEIIHLSIPVRYKIDDHHVTISEI